MFQSNKHTVLGTEKCGSVWYSWLCEFTNNEAYKLSNSPLLYVFLAEQQLFFFTTDSFFGAQT
jgi:hypothetical protein